MGINAGNAPAGPFAAGAGLSPAYSYSTGKGRE